MRAILGIPAGRFTETRFWAQLWGWMAGSPVGFSVAESNRIEINRSVLLERARRAYDLPPLKGQPPVPLLMLDTDIEVAIPLDQAMDLVYEDIDAGYDVVCSPTVHLERGTGRPIVLIRDMDGDRALMPEDAPNPYEVAGAAFGFVALSPRCVLGAEAVGTYKGESGSLEHPKYFDWSDTTEDYDFCERSRARGLRVCIDARLKTHHLKTVPLPSWGSG